MNIRQNLSRRWPAVLIALFALTVVSSPLRAADVSVNCKRGDDLQAAIDTAAEGEVITIKGTCLGTFFIDQSHADNLTLSGDHKATLDGDSAGPVLTVISRTVVVADLSIQGGGGPTAGLDLSDSDITLVGVRVTGNHAEFTGTGFAIGGIAALHTALTIIDSKVTGNTATSEADDNGFVGAYPGISSVDGTLSIENSTVEDNHASAVDNSGLPFGFAEAIGGIQHIGVGAATITDTVVKGNSGHAISAGLGIADGGISAVFTGPITIIDSRVVDNSAISSQLATGGLEFFLNGPVLVIDSKFHRNSAEGIDAAGGISFDGDLGNGRRITDSKVKMNTASGTGRVAGGILNLDDGIVTLEDSKVKNNDPIDCFGLDCAVIES